MRIIDADKLHYKRVNIQSKNDNVKSSVVVFAKELNNARTIGTCGTCVYYASSFGGGSSRCLLHDQRCSTCDFCSWYDRVTSDDSV